MFKIVSVILIILIINSCTKYITKTEVKTIYKAKNEIVKITDSSFIRYRILCDTLIKHHDIYFTNTKGEIIEEF